MAEHKSWMCVGGAILALAVGISQRSYAEVGHAPAPDLNAALHKFDDLYRSKSSIARLEMRVETEANTRELRMQAFTRGAKQALIILEAPARDKGTATLRVDDNLWNYLPRIARTIRVPPSAMLSSWMGSDFTNDDLVHSSSYAEDFNASLVGDAPGGGKLVRLDAKPGLIGLWKRIDVVFNADLSLPQRAEYFDRRMRHVRSMVFDEVHDLDGRRVPTRMTLTPLDNPGHKTVIQYLELHFDADVPDSTFSLAHLEHSR